MNSFKETDVSRAILDSYYAKFTKALSSDIIIVGAGPSGLVAAWHLAENGFRVVVLEKRLSPGGGIWGGSLGMNEVVVQKEALFILDGAGVRYQPSGCLFTADAIELASALGLKALHAGAFLFNLMTAEDVCIRSNRVSGIVANRSMLNDSLPIDPVVFSAKAIKVRRLIGAAATGILKGAEVHSADCRDPRLSCGRDTPCENQPCNQ